MTHVLVLITVFSSASGLVSNTVFQEFASLQACDRAATEIRRGVDQIAGTLGRDVIAQCHALGHDTDRARPGPGTPRQ